MAITMSEINKLSVAEKIILAEKIWDSEQIIWVYNLVPETIRYIRPDIFSEDDIVKSTILDELRIKVNDIVSEE